MNRTWIATLAVVGALAATRSAHAQYWLQDRTLQEGRGIRTGNFELHPGIGAEFGYDSNVFYTSPNTPTAAGTSAVIPALRLRVTPSIAVSTLGPQRTANSDSAQTALPTVNFRGGLALIYHEFIPVQQPDTVSRLRNLGANANFRLELFPQRTWQFVLADEFTRTIQGAVPTDAAIECVRNCNFNRDFNRAAAELVYAPGRGILDLRFGYALNASFFEDPSYTIFNYLQHEASVRLRWRFLPKTALVWEGYVTPLNYIDTAGTTTGLFSSTPVRTRIGLNGLLTEKLAVLFLVGYQATFFDLGDNLDTVIGQAELRWIIDAASSVRVGFIRDIQNSFFGNYYLRDRGYVTYVHSFSGRFLLSIDAGLGLFDYGYLAQPGTGAFNTAGGSGFDPTTRRFSAVRAEGTLFGEYRLSDVFGINATLRGTANVSDVRFGMGSTALPIEWTKLEAFAGLRANW